jgi:hypothetical protein
MIHLLDPIRRRHLKSDQLRHRKWTRAAASVPAIGSAFAAVSFLSASPAMAAQDQQITSKISQGAVVGTVHWTGRRSFEIKNISLSDTQCNGEGVGYQVHTNEGVDFPKFIWQGDHCDSSVKNLAFSGDQDIDISSIRIRICRVVGSVPCTNSPGTGSISVNPFVS